MRFGPTDDGTRDPARHGDPETSQQGAASAKAKRPRVVPVIQACLAAADKDGTIGDEIYDYVGARIEVQGRDSTTPRLKEMEDAKLACRHQIGFNDKGNPIYQTRRSKRTGFFQDIWWSYAVGIELGFVDPIQPSPSYAPASAWSNNLFASDDQ